MGRKIPVVSYLCGALFRKKPPPVEDSDDVFEEALSSPTTSGGDGAFSPAEDAAGKPSSPDHGHHHHHLRTASCGRNLQHWRSNSGVSKLVSSMSLRVIGSGGIAERFKHEDSVWKKTIILGERCRVPDDDDDDFKLFDEKGNKIMTYHPKSHSGLLQYSKQNTTLGHDEISRN